MKIGTISSSSVHWDLGARAKFVPERIAGCSVAQARNDFVSIRAGAPVAPSTRYISQWWEPNR
jgi:hypothetical protein